MTLDEAKALIVKSILCEDAQSCGIAEDCEDCTLYVPRDIMNEAHKVILNSLK